MWWRLWFRFLSQPWCGVKAALFNEWETLPGKPSKLSVKFYSFPHPFWFREIPSSAPSICVLHKHVLHTHTPLPADILEKTHLKKFNPNKKMPYSWHFLTWITNQKLCQKSNTTKHKRTDWQGNIKENHECEERQIRSVVCWVPWNSTDTYHMTAVC